MKTIRNRELKSVIPVLGLMLFFVQGDIYATSPLLIKIAEDLGISISQAGLSAVFYMIPFGLFTIIAGPLGDKFGKIKLIYIAAFGTTIFSGLSGIAPDLFSLCVFRAVNGAFASAIMPVSMALIGDLSGDNPGQLHSSLSRTMALMFFGGAVAPVIGGALSYFGSWRFVYFTYGIFELIMSVLIIALIRMEFKGDRNLTIRKAYSEAFSNKELIRIVTIMSLLGMTVLGLFTYTGKYTEQSLGISVFHVGLILAFYGIGSLFGGRIAPRLKERMNSNYFIVASGIGVISLLLLTFIPNIYLFPVSLFGFGLAFTLIQPMLVALAQSSFPQKRGTVMSLASFNMTIGGGLGTLLYGFILKQYDFMVIYLIGILLFLGIAVFTTMILYRKLRYEAT